MSYEAFGELVVRLRARSPSHMFPADCLDLRAAAAICSLQIIATAALDLEQIMAKCIKCGETEIVSTELGGEALKDRLNTLCAALKAAGMN